MALRWKGPARSVAVGLFLFRLVGFVAFEITEDRVVLLAVPNVFEVWFLFVASLPHWRPNFNFSRRNVVLALIPLTGKVFQEYALHGGMWLDSSPRSRRWRRSRTGWGSWPSAARGPGWCSLAGPWPSSTPSGMPLQRLVG